MSEGLVLIPEDDSVTAPALEEDELPTLDVAAVVPNPHAGYILIGHNVFHSESDAPADRVLEEGDHELVVYVYLEKDQRYIAVTTINNNPNLNCNICLSLLAQAERVHCRGEHRFCHECVKKMGNTCPTCRQVFSGSSFDRNAQREISELATICPWCSQSSTLSEIADHLAHCDQQPQQCAICQNYISPEQLSSHTQCCVQSLVTTDEQSTLEQSRESLVNIIQQLASALNSAIIPETLEHGDTSIRLANRIVLIPVSGSPEIFTRIGSAEPLEFYVRVDLSEVSSQKYTNEHIVRTSCVRDDKVFYFDVKLKYGDFCDFVNFKFTHECEPLGGDWELTVLNEVGEELTKEVSKHATQEILPEGGCIIFNSAGFGKNVPEEQTRYGIFKQEAKIWQKPPEQRIYYFRVRFISK